MSEQHFDAFTRRAAQAVSRRSSLMALGGATLAAVVAKPAITDAKKNKSNKKAKKKARKKCKKQVGQCETFLGAQFPQGLQCCPFLSNCDTTQFLSCLFNAA